jgi:D-methionine transport system permease protein
MTDPGWFAQWTLRIAELWPLLWRATLETLYMVAASTALSLALGFVVAVFMILFNPHGLRSRPNLYRFLDGLVNLTRSFPFIILIISIRPLTRWFVGTTIGNEAAIFPLVIAAIPFAARLIEASLLEVDKGVVEAARSFGAGDFHIVLRVMLPEALPSIILNISVLAINLLGYSAMAGTVGGGGLGDLAIKYGYNRFQTDVMLYSVFVLLIMVQIMQSSSNYLYKKLR